MSLNKDQKLAVDCRDKHILTLAGPGAGKTFTMLQRISTLIDEGRDPRSFLVLTFTNAAAFEMKERFRKLHPDDRIIPEFRTFHSFCYHILCKNKKIREQMGYTQVPNIISEADEKKLRSEAAGLVNCTLSNKKIVGLEPLEPKDRFQYECLIKALDNIMFERNLITFDVLCYRICKLFENNDPLIQRYFDQYENIFVDEFQDTDNKQWKFVKSFKDADIFLVADALQAIYGFRGADSSIVKQIAAEGDYTVIKLHENYRSTAPICAYINDFSTYAKDSYRILIHSDAPGSKVENDHVSQYSMMGMVTTQALNLMLDKLIDYKDEGTTAILARTNKEVQSISSFLNTQGIEHVVGRTNSKAINILKSIYDENFLFNWLSVSLSDWEYSRLLRLQTLAESNGEEYTFQNFKNDFNKNYTVNTITKMVEDARNRLETGEMFEENPETILKDLKQIIHLRRKILTPKSSNAAIIIDTVLSSLDVSEEGSIYVGTIHSSKGLEYDSVIVMGPGSYSFKLTSEDNKNLYYVAISRAKKNLYIVAE